MLADERLRQELRGVGLAPEHPHRSSSRPGAESRFGAWLYACSAAHGRTAALDTSYRSLTAVHPGTLVAVFAARTIASATTSAPIAPSAVSETFAFAARSTSPAPGRRRLGVIRVDGARRARIDHHGELGQLRLAERHVGRHHCQRRRAQGLVGQWRPRRPFVSKSLRNRSTERTKALPSAVRAPARMVPCRQSRTSPAALTTTSAPTTTSPSRIDAEPMPPFIPRMPRPTNILPTVAPVPAPTLPSATADAAAAWHARYASSGPTRIRPSPSDRSSITAPTTMGTRTLGHPSRSRRRALRGIGRLRRWHQAPWAPAGEQQAVNLLERAHRLQHHAERFAWRRPVVVRAGRRRVARTGSPCTRWPSRVVKCPTRRPPTSVSDPAARAAVGCQALPTAAGASRQPPCAPPKTLQEVTPRDRLDVRMCGILALRPSGVAWPRHGILPTHFHDDTLLQFLGGVARLPAVPLAAAAPGAAPAFDRMPAEGRDTPKIRLGYASPDEAGMRRLKQIGVDHVLQGGPRIPWTEADVRARIDAFKAGGITHLQHDDLGLRRRDLWPSGRRREDRRRDQLDSRRWPGGAAGRRIQLLREPADGGLQGGAGRAGAGYTAYDYTLSKDLQPKEGVGTHTRAEQLKRAEHFLKAVVPEAEKATCGWRSIPMIRRCRSAAAPNSSWPRSRTGRSTSNWSTARSTA